MAHRSKEIRAAVQSALERAGAVDLVASTSGNTHQRFDFYVGEIKGRFVFASTPKSDRAIRNAKAIAKRTVENYRTGRTGPRTNEGRGLSSPLPC